jgi:hypothetical protein
MRAASSTTAADVVSDLSVKAMPNPSSTHFTLTIKSNNDAAVAVTVTDVTGRVIERRANVAANVNLQLGSNYQTGVYFVEVKQGAKSEKLKLVKL